MRIHVHGSVSAEQLASVSAWVAEHRITEHAVRAALEGGYRIVAAHEMDEFTIDLVVAWGDDVVLVYDTT